MVQNNGLVVTFGSSTLSLKTAGEMTWRYICFEIVLITATLEYGSLLPKKDFRIKSQKY